MAERPGAGLATLEVQCLSGSRGTPPWRRSAPWPPRGTPADLGQLSRERPATVHPYRSGGLLVHYGHLLHAIAPVPWVFSGDERVTLQGHAVRLRDGWLLYW